MKTNKYIEGNKIIAEFMGYEYIPYSNDNNLKPGWWEKDITLEQQSFEAHLRKMGKSRFLCRRHPELRYCNDWNILMKVVEKIEDLDIVASFQIENPIVCIWSSTYSDFGDIEINCVGINKIKAVWEACVEFIKLYNGN